MSRAEVKTLFSQGLWSQNPGLVQLLGLCPLLAVSNTLANAACLGFATIFVLTASNTLISLIRSWIPSHLRMPVYVLIIASFVTAVQLLMQAYFFSLYESLGIFLALITTNCVIMGRAEAYASKNPIHLAFLDALAQGLGFTLVLVILGALREWLTPYFLLSALPAGAFLLLGALIAAKNWISNKP